MLMLAAVLVSQTSGLPGFDFAQCAGCEPGVTALSSANPAQTPARQQTRQALWHSAVGGTPPTQDLPRCDQHVAGKAPVALRPLQGRASTLPAPETKMPMEQGSETADAAAIAGLTLDRLGWRPCVDVDDLLHHDVATALRALLCSRTYALTPSSRSLSCK